APQPTWDTLYACGQGFRSSSHGSPNIGPRRHTGIGARLPESAAAGQARARAASSCESVNAVLRRFDSAIATTMIATETTAITIRAVGEASGPTVSCTTAGAINSE